MKTFKKLMSEVAEPKSGDEKRFKDKHIIDKVDHPVALDHQFTGEIPGKGSAKRIADHEKGEDEKVYEAMDPVNPAALKGKHKDRKDKDIDNDGDVDSSDEYLHNRRKAIAKAMKKEDTSDSYEQLVAEAYEFTESAWEEVPMMKRQLYFVAYAAEEIMEWLDSGVDPEEWFQNKMAAMHSNMRTLHAYVEGEKRMMDTEVDMWEETDLEEDVRKMSHGRLKFHMNNKSVPHGSYSWDQMKAERDRRLKTGQGEAYKKAKASMSEDAEKLDELSPNTLHSYIKKAAGNMAGNAAVAAAQASSSMKKSSPDVKRKMVNRMKGITGASGRLADKANMAEETQLDEVTMSAIKKPVNQTGPDGKTRTVYKTIKKTDHDMHGQDMIKHNEEVELDEALKAGIVKLNDGSSVILKKQDADLMNKMLKDLSANNRKSMMKTAMMDKSGFEEILGFAREAL